MAWQDVTRKKREQIAALIPPEWRFSSQAIPSRITQPNIVHIVPLFLSPSKKRSQVYRYRSYCRLCIADVSRLERSSPPTVIVQCLSENNFESAAQRAAELDGYWRAHGGPIGPLHGLPISLMDRFNVAGLDSSSGFASWVGNAKTADDEGVLVQHLRALGAVIFCKTNVPMSMMVGETVNNTIGTTWNPQNRTLSAGGACGGEGALIALKGSPLGIGTELAGSSRIPAAFNGIYALKICEARLPRDGLVTVVSVRAVLFPKYGQLTCQMRGLPIAAGSIGLLSSSISGLQTVFRALLDSSPWINDAETLEMPWRQDKYAAIAARTHRSGHADGRLVFGLLSSDGHVQPHPNIERAMHNVRQALQQRGYEFRIFGSNSGISIREAIKASSEPPTMQVKAWYEQGHVDGLSATELWELCHVHSEYRKRYADYWREMSNRTRSGRAVDGVIQPVAATTAVRDSEFHYYGYTAVANVLDYPAAAFPVQVGSSSFDDNMPHGPPFNAVDALVRSCYRLEDAKGMPVGLQVIGQRHHEEHVLAMVQAISSALSEYNPAMA
ncbi:hypothetical protein LTR48_003844 [Friedmanniomyces endolithicus]|uniref:Amidase domain-containing protein n=1 Tax=Rachicladosporium monterosium TaxID=1507873 RepID=A0ABR0LF18_9PEZI|nr:hypothetical protein LTR48_003844 [Friedmanniomyces endolithicus]KAK5147785.1 hypothetical protein LTR32_000804 [Rachicladosporium monterosium]